MNSIVGLLDKSDYDYWDSINYQIDGRWLDKWLEELYPGNFYKGMVPTLNGWMMEASEDEVVWTRILPAHGEATICPILMCPDESDFSCTLVMAEVENCGNSVKWKRLGLNQTKEWEPEKVGSVVNWFDNFPVLQFSMAAYVGLLEAFKKQTELDRLREIAEANAAESVCIRNN